jgi:hypothetical protein
MWQPRKRQEGFRREGDTERLFHSLSVKSANLLTP